MFSTVTAFSSMKKPP